MKKQDNRETIIEQATLVDLPLTGEQSEDAKGGPTHGAGGGGGTGKVSMNDFHFVMK